jgi:hypothetical protein
MRGWLISLLIAAAYASECDSKDNADDCAALVAFAKATGYAGWKNNKGWLRGGSICGWYGVKCGGKGTAALARRRKGGSGSGRVTELDVKGNGIKGSIPDAIGGKHAYLTT